jgi:hypothetical protein
VDVCRREGRSGGDGDRMCQADLVHVCAVEEALIAMCATRSAKEWMVKILGGSSNVIDADHWTSKGRLEIHWICCR